MLDFRPAQLARPQFTSNSKKDDPETGDDFLTTDEVLAYLQVSVRTVYRLVKAGKIQAVRVGRQWRFRKSAIDAWLKKARRGKDEPPRILVVDDDEAVRKMITQALVKAHYAVDTAPDGFKALERLRSSEFDLLLTDLRMPGMDGLSVIREIRRVDALLPIIILTGYSTEASAIEAINLGVSGYITKPFRVARILAVVARALRAPVPAG